MLNKKTKYAFHALTYLGQQKDLTPVLISDIAEHTHVPRKFLESILLDMKKAGILTSRMGKGGGYYLLRDPKEIKLADVIRMFSGPIALLPCVSLNYYEPCAECKDEAKCGLNKIMMQVRNDTLKILANKSLKDILKAEG